MKFILNLIVHYQLVNIKIGFLLKLVSDSSLFLSYAKDWWYLSNYQDYS